MKLSKAHLYLVSLLIILSFALGCTNSPAQKTSGLSVSMAADPVNIVAGGTVNIFVDVENKDNKIYTDVNSVIFDTGILEPEGNYELCNIQNGYKKPELRPTQSYSARCKLEAPASSELVGNTIVPVSMKTEFSTEMAFVLPFIVYTNKAYEREKLIGIPTTPSSYSFNDGNINVLVEFEEQPLVISDKDMFVHVTISNTGRGAVTNVNIKVENGNIRCGNVNLQTVGKIFPRFACTIITDGLTDEQGKDLKSYNELFKIKYSYELMNKVDIEVRK